MYVGSSVEFVRRRLVRSKADHLRVSYLRFLRCDSADKVVELRVS